MPSKIEKEVANLNRGLRRTVRTLGQLKGAPRPQRAEGLDADRLLAELRRRGTA